MSLKQQIATLVPLTIIVLGLLGYSLIFAQWQSPTATAPNNNTEAPINISVNYQAKLGDLGAVRMRAGQYCDPAGNNCWDPTTGAPGGGGDDTITVGGRCFEPAWAVTCNWNWSGDGNDNSTYIRPMNGTAANVCASVGRSYQYHTIVLAECTTPVYGWVVGAWTCNAPFAWSCSTTNGRIVRTVNCRDQFGSIVADSNCTAPKPSSDNGPCTRSGGGSDC